MMMDEKTFNFTKKMENESYKIETFITIRVTQKPPTPSSPSPSTSLASVDLSPASLSLTSSSTSLSSLLNTAEQMQKDVRKMMYRT